MSATFLIIKSAENEEEEKEFKPNLNALTLWENSLIYRAWFANLSLILGIKSLNFSNKICSSLSMINIPKNKGFGNWETH